MEAYLADEASDIRGGGLAQDVGAFQVSMQDAVVVHEFHSAHNVQKALQHPQQPPAEQSLVKGLRSLVPALFAVLLCSLCKSVIWRSL